MANLTVEVSDGNDVIVGATVTLDDDSSETSGDDGKVLFEDVTMGSHTVKVEKENYVTQTIDVTVTDDTEVTVELVAIRTASFTVNDGTDAIQGAELVIDGDTEGKKTTGSSGGCTASLSDGEHEIVVSAETYTTKTETITVDGEHTSFTISLEADSQ